MVPVGVRARQRGHPPQGMDRKAYMRAKFGDEARLRDAHARLEALGAVEGIDYAFDAITVSPNTLDDSSGSGWFFSSSTICRR